MKILVAGAGVAGLTIGWRLAEAGASVEVIERGKAGRGATWASAGMLAALSESGGATATLAGFAHASRAAWPSFAEEIENASGISIAYRECGRILVAANEARARELQARAKGEGDSEWLDADALSSREPLLSPDFFGALFIPSDAQVDNRTLGEALRIALLKSGASLRENCELLSLIVDKGRVRGAVTSDGAMEADAVVMATGAWLNGAGAGLPRIAPVKGQMIALEPPRDTRLTKSLVWNDDVYLVARGNRLLAGATVEDSGFDTCVTREAADKLFAAACRIVPAARLWAIAECWSGLRPKSDDGLPVLGETGVSGLYVASGQFRNGILFAPMVGDAMRRIVLGKDVGDLSPFDPKRFS